MAYQESPEKLSDKANDFHRAIDSLREELEAVDWYNQRAERCADPELKAVLIHNRDEEKEHAAMLIEWIRRQDAGIEKELKDWVFSNKPFKHD